MTCQNLFKVLSPTSRMGNVMGNASQLEKDVENEEWLKDLQENRILDFSRKVTHSQFLKVHTLHFYLIVIRSVKSNNLLLFKNLYLHQKIFNFEFSLAHSTRIH